VTQICSVGTETGSGPGTNSKVGSRSGSEKNYSGSTALNITLQSCFKKKQKSIFYEEKIFTEERTKERTKLEKVCSVNIQHVM
jgi:hypothetical protein